MFCKIRRIAKIHDSDFFFDFMQSSLIFKFDNSTGVEFPILLQFIISKKDLAHASLAELLLKHKLSGWIFLNKMYAFDDSLKLTRGQ